MLEVIICICLLSFCVLVVYSCIREAREVSQIRKRKVEALEAIATQLHEIKLDMYNFVK